MECGPNCGLAVAVLFERHFSIYSKYSINNLSLPCVLHVCSRTVFWAGRHDLLRKVFSRKILNVLLADMPVIVIIVVSSIGTIFTCKGVVDVVISIRSIVVVWAVALIDFNGFSRDEGGSGSEESFHQ